MLACEQALHLGNIVKSTRVRGTRGGDAPRGFAACSQAKMMLAVLKRKKKTKMTKMSHSILTSLKYVG